jgi:hypothetical protein
MLIVADCDTVIYLTLYVLLTIAIHTYSITLMLNTLCYAALHCNCITDVLVVVVPMVIGEVLHLVWQLLLKALALLH